MSKKGIQLSHSASQKFLECGMKYKLHYIDRIRPVKLGSALFFGGAVDEALNVLLGAKKKIVTYDFDESVSVLQHALDEFDTQWVKQLENPNIEYFKSDIDLSVLLDIDLEAISEFDKEVENHEEFLEECFAILKAKDTMSEEDQLLYNRIAWHCLYRKGLMLIEAYNNDILPQIHTVFDIQKKVELPDDHGNNLIGYIDAIVSFIDAPDKKVVLDNKTSSKPYKDDSVAESPQLATYCEHEGLDTASYAVVEKAIRKRDPRTRTQLIIDKIPEKTFDKTFEEYDNVLEGIENEEFDKNYESGCYSFGRPCDYYHYCRSNAKNMNGLENK
jgi:hypothetical protein